jgi:beta-mannosidase
VIRVVEQLTGGWRLSSPSGEEIEAEVPGTVAGALRRAGLAADGDLDGHDWTFSCRFEGAPPAADEQVLLRLGGIATVADAVLNGRTLLHSESMFREHTVDVGELLSAGGNELRICCRALAPLLQAKRRPRARWRTRLVSNGNLRFYRTMLLGRAPGFAPGPPVVGPWRPISLERSRGLAVDRLSLRPRLEGDTGIVEVDVDLRALDPASDLTGARLEVEGPTGRHSVDLRDGRGRLEVPGVARWWPHTHGSPAMYDARLHLIGAGEEIALEAGRIGFRSLRSSRAIESEGLALEVNGETVFARGAVWTPLDLHAPHARVSELRRTLATLSSAGMNLLRIPGTGCYESEEFYDLCDELGILVWQDFMFANLDYPEADAEFMAEVEHEARAVVDALARRPSLAVLCGGSEVAQQVAMLGLDPALASGPLYGELLPSVVAEAGVEAPYIPSSPWGGDLPFRPDRGVAHYYGVGAYLRPFEDCRRSEVPFASECLAFANVPDGDALAEIHAPAGLTPHSPAWKAGIPRDTGAGWDFEDVRDHYLALLFGVDPVGLRSQDVERYLELSRAVSGEVMAEVFGEWRRRGSPCQGGLVLWSRDLRPGAGWGVLDHRGEPKVALQHLRRALAPVAVWGTDEGLGGIVAHVANDRAEPLEAILRVALYREHEALVAEASRAIELPAHGASEHNVEGLLGRFVDVTWAYRFGPPGQDLVVLSLEGSGRGGTPLISQSFRFPVGRSVEPQQADVLGLAPRLETVDEDTLRLTLSARRLAYGVRVELPNFIPDDDAFNIEPGHARVVALRRRPGGVGGVQQLDRATITAVNLSGRLTVRTDGAT